MLNYNANLLLENRNRLIVTMKTSKSMMRSPGFLAAAPCSCSSYHQLLRLPSRRRPPGPSPRALVA
jgi:hypothetical protein